MVLGLTTSGAKVPLHGNGGHAAVIWELPINPPEGWIIAVGDNAIRQKEARKKEGVVFATAIHRSAIISPSAKIGEGTVIMAGVVVQARAVIGKHCILNTGCTADHDCIIEDFAHLAPGVHLCGGVHVGEGALVGVGSCAIPGARISPWIVIPAGSVIK